MIISFLKRDTEIEITPSCSPRRASSENVLFDLERPIWKFDQVRSMSDNDLSRSICTSSEAVRRAKSFGTISASLTSILSRLIGVSLIATSLDLRWPSHAPHPSSSVVQMTGFTDEVIGHDPEGIGWFRSVYVKLEAFSCLTIDL